jgi:1,4-dihydroxy-2-naphthoate octaprenyltransferase
MIKAIKDFLRIISELIILSRPEWGFIFSGVAFMLSLFYLLPLKSLIVGWVSIYAFLCGHFAINGLFDKESDAINPRRFSLRNPLSYSSLLTPHIIYLWVALLWLSLIPLNLIFIPFSSVSYKVPIASFLFFLAVGCSIFYSVPPIRLKSKPFIDIIITLVIAGVCFPLYVGLLGPNEIVNEKLLFYGMVFSILLVLGIHWPTILTDLEIDIQNRENTTAVYLGRVKTSYLTSFGIFLRVLGFAVINIVLMKDGLLITSIFPFILGGVEVILAINLAWRKNHSSVELLWKSVIITSIIGGIIFGFLYTPHR